MTPQERLTSAYSIMRNLNCHAQVTTQLEKMGMDHIFASREAFRRMKDANFKYDNWRDYFTTVELEGIDLPR